MADAVGAHPVANPGTVVLLKAGQKHRKYTATEKVQILDFADSSSDRKASDTFGVNRHSVRDWRNQEEAIRRQAAAGGKLAQRARVEGPKGLKPFVPLPRKRPIPTVVEQFGNKLNLVWAGAGNSSMNDHFTELYLAPRSERTTFPRLASC